MLAQEDAETRGVHGAGAQQVGKRFRRNIRDAKVQSTRNACRQIDFAGTRWTSIFAMSMHRRSSSDLRVRRR